jgi:hypothetical protein
MPITLKPTVCLGSKALDDGDAVSQLRGLHCTKYTRGFKDNSASHGAPIMAQRHNLAIVERGKAAKKPDDDKEAQTLRLPAEYWRRARILAAMRGTSMVGMVQIGLDEVFKKLTDQERVALGMKPAQHR